VIGAGHHLHEEQPSVVAAIVNRVAAGSPAGATP